MSTLAKLILGLCLRHPAGNSDTDKFIGTKLCPQWIAAIGVTMLLNQIGLMCGWTSPYVASLTSPDSPLPLTTDEAAWVASLIHVGRFAGAIGGAICVHTWGSRGAIVATHLPIASSWTLIALANSPGILYAARLIGGFGLGMAFSCFPLFIGEIASPAIRGAIVTIAFCGVPFGNVAASLIGSYASMRIFGISTVIPCILNVAVFLWLPDSPHHLVARGGRIEEAKESLRWYRGGDSDADLDREIEALQKYMLTTTTTTTAESGGSFKDSLVSNLANGPVRRATLIVLGLFIYMQICGLNSVTFFMELIFRKGKLTSIDPADAVTLENLAGALTAVLSFNLMDKCGRRVLLIVSACGVMLSTVALGTHFLLISLGFDPMNFEYLPIIAVLIFMVSYTIGLTPVPSTILSELLPSNCKCVSACLASMTAALFAFGGSRLYQPLVDHIGEAYVFYLHAVITATVIPFALYFLPETKGKSLQEIQDDLMAR